MADNVIVRVPEQQFIRGEDGYSPEVTIENIDHGHSVTITDRDHPTGQSFNVMDGDSAYEQAVAGGYTGTEAQFNEELSSFKELSDETKDAAPFYAEYGVTTKAEIETAINGKRQIYVHSALGMDYAPLVGTFIYLPMFGNVPQTGYRFAAIEGTTQYIYDLRDEWSTSENDLAAPAQRAEAAAATALTRMNSADASAQAAAGSAGDASTAATTATTKAGEASDSATAADGSAKDSEAYAIGKRNGTDVGSSDPAYHNNAKYYAEQAALIVDDVEQVMTPTTIGPTALATFDASVAGMPLKGLTVGIEPAQAAGTPSPENPLPITGWTTCKLHRTGVSLIGGDAFIGNTFSKTANGYQLSYNGSSIANRASAFADIRGLPAGRYTIEMLNPSYPQGVEVNIRRNTAGSTVTMGVIINADSATGRRTYNIPENTTSLQLYIIPDTTSLNTSITMSDIVLVREGDASEPYKGNVYNITFPSEAGAVYGGTLDVVNRKLNSYPYYSSYNGETIIGPWISSMDVYTPGATPTLGAQVVDMGGAATSYDLSDAPEITTLLGENNIWANRGDVTVTYGAYLETVKAYADQAADSAAAAEDAQEAAEAVLASIPSDYTELTEDVDDLKSALDFVDESVTPVNLFSGVYTAVLPPSSASGSDTANANNKTTDFISAVYGDKIYCGYTGNPATAMTSYNPVFVTEYDAEKQWLYRSAQYPAVDDANGKKTYTVTQANTKFVRVSFANSMVTTSGRLFEIAVNIDTSGYVMYSEYFEPYDIHDSLRIKHLEDVVYGVNMKVIDCWGDSRIEMIANQGTSLCDYLQTSLGNAYNVCNYGISSQSSGMCAARLGSNEVFVTLTNNQIPASGEVQLTDIKCTAGNIKNLYAFSATAYIPCILNGVRGRLSRASQSDYTSVKFLRDSDGSAISVKPQTKIVVDDMNSKHHISIFWWGKNDFASAVPYVESGILDNYEKAVKFIGHDKFIILGETCSITPSYESGGTNRTYLDNINNMLAEKYPDNFIDINAYLSSEQALTDVGLTATATDLEFIAKGFPCYQLMVYSTNTSDTAHPNEKGREAIAYKLYAWMQTKGWV